MAKSHLQRKAIRKEAKTAQYAALIMLYASMDLPVPTKLTAHQRAQQPKTRGRAHRKMRSAMQKASKRANR